MPKIVEMLLSLPIGLISFIYDALFTTEDYSAFSGDYLLFVFIGNYILYFSLTYAFLHFSKLPREHFARLL